MTVPRLRLLVTTAVLGVLVLRLGPGPFLDGLRAVDAPTVLAVLVIGAVTTTAYAVRWRAVARGLGLELPAGRAVAACYRSQLLNSVLPGGVVGDVERGLVHGRETGSAPVALRAVAWDRVAGQAVQVVLAAIALLVLVPPLRALGALLLVGTVVLAASAALVPLPRSPRSRAARWWSVVSVDVRRALRPGPAALLVVALSTVVVAGHVATFVIAARAAGVLADPAVLVPVGLLVLVAMAVPVHVAGWGLREGAAAWAFALVGLGADLGVRTAVVYGVVAALATLPGLAVLLAERRPRRLVGREVVLDG